MRVLLASQEMPPETGWGGIGTYVANLAPALAEAGAEVHVLSVVRGQDRSERELQPGLIVHRRPLRRPPGVGRVTGLNETWERLSLAFAVDHELRALSVAPDVVEAPEWRAEGLVLGLRAHPAVVVRMHSAAEQLFAYSRRPLLDARLAIALERRSMLAADLLVSTPANVAAMAGRLGGHHAPIRAVGLPVAVRPIVGRPAGNRIVFVGRLERVKGPEILVAAARFVLERIPDAHFVFVGGDTGRAPGSYLKLLTELARRNGVEHALEFLGHVDHPTTLAQIELASVCVFPARQETFGYGAAEAAACGVPVVASGLPAFESLFGALGSAELVSGEDPRSWANAIVALLLDPDRARIMGAAGRARVIEQCAPSHIAQQSLELYAQAQELAGADRRRC